MPEPGIVFDYNRYAYVRGRVMNATDPSGHDSCTYQEGTNGQSGTIQCNPTPIIGGETQSINVNGIQLTCTGNCQSLQDILLKALGEVKEYRPNITIRRDEHGIPVGVDFEQDEVMKALAEPLQQCAIALGGACGISYGVSANTGVGAGGRLDLAVYVDEGGMMGMFFEVGGGAYTPIPVATSKLAITGIPEATTLDLDGASAQLGFTGAVGATGMAAEAVFLKSDLGSGLHGQSYGYAYTAAPYAAEVHLTMTWAHPIAYLNTSGPR